MWSKYNSKGVKMLSVIIPAYNEETNIGPAVDAVRDVLVDARIPGEIIFVDDGSSDGTWEEIIRQSETDASKIEQKRLSARTPAVVRGIRFSRNFGKEAAMYAGLTESRGDCCVVMDCDLQHPPEKIEEMYRLWEQGFEVIEGVKESRGEESLFHSIATATFYAMITRIIGIDMSRASDFKLLDRKAVNVLLNMREKRAFFRALSSWIGFSTTEVTYDVRERRSGKTKWSTRGLIMYAIDNLASFTTIPMQIVTFMGLMMLGVTIVQGAEALYSYFSGNALGGFTTVILLQLFTGSITMLSLGIIGYYIARIYEEVKDRPKFIISDRTGADEQQEEGQNVQKGQEEKAQPNEQARGNKQTRGNEPARGTEQARGKAYSHQKEKG